MFLIIARSNFAVRILNFTGFLQRIIFSLPFSLPFFFFFFFYMKRVTNCIAFEKIRL